MSQTRLQLGACDYPEHIAEQQWLKQAQRQKQAGLDFIRIAEFAWSLMEPTEDHFEWQWLDKAIDTYASQGLKVIIGTPTATPPAWLITKYPEILPFNQQGQQLQFGSRRHYDYASNVYLKYSKRIVTELAKRYGEHPAVVGWQIDNEHAHEGTACSFGGATERAFPVWLEKKYHTIEQLNHAWGNAFWSQDYQHWNQIKPPHLTAVNQANPSHLLDFRRCCSELVVDFQQAQIDIIRAYSPERFITHNFVLFSEQTDNYKLAQSLDFVSWDSYPTGMLCQFLPWQNHDFQDKYMRTGHPDLVSLNHDLYRGLKSGTPIWVMEQQCGQTNWAEYNPLPAPNAVSLWSSQAWAHGTDAVVYFRWKAAAMAQEVMHSGLYTALDQATPALAEVTTLNTQIMPCSTINNRVALVHDYESLWLYDRVSHQQELSYWQHFLLFYRALRKVGVDVDIIHPNQMASQSYQLIVLPSTLMLSAHHLEDLIKLRENTQLILGPRVASFTPNAQALDEQMSTLLTELSGTQRYLFDSLKRNHSEWLKPTDDKHTDLFASQFWCESYQCLDARSLYQYQSGPLAGQDAVCKKLNCLQIGALSESLIDKLVAEVLVKLNIPIEVLPEGVRLSKRGHLTYWCNFNQHSAQVGSLYLPPVSWTLNNPSSG